MPLIDWGKAIASQLIVWHHLVVYGPMRRAADALAPDLFAWLADPARLAVQVFLVLGGYLAARTLMPAPAQAVAWRVRALPGLLCERWWRLMRPCWVALALAMLAAGAARVLMDDADTPAAPVLAQALSNALLLHDFAGFPALSAGLWYVGIDLQLFALTALLVALLRASGLQGVRLATLAVALVAGGVALSLLWVNRLPGADLWAPYFFGSYGLGVLAHWLGQPGAEPRRASRWVRGLGGVALVLLVALALWLEWRSRIALAGVLALALALNLGRARLPQTWGHGRIRHLARISYGVFLVHYPVSLLVASLLTWAAPESALANLLGLVTAWLLSLWAGDALLRGVAGWQALRRELGQAASIGEQRQFGLVRRVDLLGWPASGRRVLP